MPLLLGERKSGKFVVPGDLLGVIEEFLLGPGTFAEDGNIYSLTTGHLLIDSRNQRVSVYRKVRTVIFPKEDSIVIGHVSQIQDRNLTLRIFQVGDLLIHTFLDGVMHISDVSKGYMQTMFDAFKMGDLVRAKVISTKNRAFHLTTREDRLGVISAVCSYCGNSLKMKGTVLKCFKCNRVRRRKISSNYDKYPH